MAPPESSSAEADRPESIRLGRLYGRYVPRLIIERLRREERAVDSPSAEGLRGAVLFADISGFTPLTEAFAARGPEGAEALTRILNDYFGRMTEIVFDHGGDVLKFAGDALMALWRPDEDGGDTADVCARATACGLALQEGLAGYTAEGQPLSLKVAIGVGDAIVVHVGGQFGRWEFAIAGAPLNQVGQIGDLAERGDVLVSSEVFARIRQTTDSEIVLDPRTDPELTEFPPRRVRRIDGVAPRRAKPPADLPGSLTPALRGYLPASITGRIDAGQTDFLGELRRLTILFVNLPDITSDTSLDRAQAAFRGLQKALYLPWEGSINKLSVDDKGISLVAALGLPPFAHEDDPARGAQAALAMHKALEDEGLRCSIGVATGRVYCGSVGGSGRQEYTIMGDRVNLAARLMQHAGGGILCDATTVERSSDQVRYDAGTSLTVKGKSRPLTVHRPLGRRRRGGADGGADVLIGREADLATLRSAVEALEAGRDSVVYLEGEAGIGKSRLLGQFVSAEAAPRAIHILRGAGDAIEASTPYFAWQGVLTDLCDLESLDGPARRARLEVAVGDDAARADLLPLLDDVLPLEFPATELTRQMQGEVRAANLESLVVALLQRAAAERPVLLVVDDVHWIDSASWELLRACVREVGPLAVILGSRPIAAPDVSDALRRLLDAPETQVMRLERMAPAECVALVAHRLGVPALPEAAARLVQERGEGHPYFSEEIGYALRDAGVLIVEDGIAHMGRADLADLDLPDTIEGIITSRIDRLTPPQQLALKVASCIGRVFTTRVLREVYPVAGDRATLPEALAALAALDLTPVEAPEPEPAWIFKHAITRQVTYDLMLYAQRKQLHEAIARWYEHTHGDDLESHLPLLAHHWSRAEHAGKAVHYLPRAAEAALASNACTEALRFIDEAERLAATLDVPPPALERARWRVMRGAAHNALGRLTEARDAFEHALALLGHPVPGGTVALVGAIAVQARIQARHRRAGWPAPPTDPAERARLLLAAQTVERLFMIYFFANDSARLLWTVLRATNLAETVGEETPVLVRCYTDLAAALSSVPLPAQVDHYAERAMDLAERFDDHLADAAWANLGTAACLAANGAWSEVERRNLMSVETNRTLGDLRRWEEASANLGLIRTIYGRFDAPEDGLYMPVLQAARKRGITQTEGWGLSLWGMNLVYRQEFDDLERVADTLAHWYDTTETDMDAIARLEVLSVILCAALRRDDADAVERRLAAGFALVDGMGRPTQYRVLPAVYLFTEGAIDAWRTAPSAVARRRRRRIGRLLRHLRRYAGIFPIGRPRSAWLEGRVAWYDGRPQRAFAHWRRALEQGEALEMAYECMLAAGSLAACLPASETEERARCAALATELAEEMGVPGSRFLAAP